jgi:predicted secreted protein
MSDAKLGYGSKFLMAALASSSALTKLAEVTSVTLPNEQVAEVEVTHYESPGRTREFIAGLNDAGEITIGMNYLAGSATDALIVAAKADGAVRTMRIVVPDGTANGQAFTFPGFIRGYERDVPIDDKMTAQVTVRVAGAVEQDEAPADPTTI